MFKASPILTGVRPRRTNRASGVALHSKLVPLGTSPCFCHAGGGLKSVHVVSSKADQQWNAKKKATYTHGDELNGEHPPACLGA